MELRKNPKIDLERKRSAFFNIGLAISLLLVTSAFEWKFYNDGIVEIPDQLDENFEKIIEIPPTVQPPPPPPKIISPEYIVVPDDKQIEDEVEIIDVEMTDEMVIDELIFDDPLPVEEPDVIFDIVETQPSPMGGMNEFYKYVGKNMKYPNQARRMGIEGRVFVQFVVDKQGKLTEVQAIKGIGGGCDEEAVRVVKNMPSWSPGKQRGRPVKVRMVLPITFRLN